MGRPEAEYSLLLSYWNRETIWKENLPRRPEN